MNHELKLYCNTNLLADLRTFLDAILKKTSLSDIEQHQVMLAVEEVCANLIIHSHACNSQEYIEVFVKEKSDLLIFEILDYGKRFNILEYQEPNLTQVIKTKRKGGLGIILVKRIMDKIEFESNGNKNTCRLFKLLKSK